MSCLVLIVLFDLLALATIYAENNNPTTIRHVDYIFLYFCISWYLMAMGLGEVRRSNNSGSVHLTKQPKSKFIRCSLDRLLPDESLSVGYKLTCKVHCTQVLDLTGRVA